MIEDLSGVTPKLVMSALDALMQRHQVISHNIANASTPNYSAKRVAFEQQVANFSLEINNRLDEKSLADQVQSLNSIIEEGQLIYSTGQEVELDQELVELTENVLKYRVLLEANAKRGALMGMAISGRSN